jgi:hypothetical protein
MKTAPMPWWRTDTYEVDWAVPAEFSAMCGPKGVALVKAYADGKTTGGWGTDDGGSGTFMPNYMKDVFAPRKALYAFEKKQQPFAIVMRSVRMLCVDIDGKNGGLEHAKKLGALPPTLSETSKSGDGYHLFYLVEDEWDDELGFNRLADRIGIEQGVDIRVTGCVFHYPQQRWNDRPAVLAPQFLIDLLLHTQRERTARKEYAAKVVASGDQEEILMMQSQLESDLAKPIAAGQRNNTLFAIGQQMRDAGMSNWQALIEKRANEIGLDVDETDKLITNIGRY